MKILKEINKYKETEFPNRSDLVFMSDGEKYYLMQVSVSGNLILDEIRCQDEDEIEMIVDLELILKKYT